MPVERRYWLLAGVMGIAVSSILLLSSGPVMSDWRLPFIWLPGVLSEATDIQKTVLINIRLPRLVLGLMVGAVLAQSGTAMQTLCRNPLADPGLIGISGGAAVFALAVIALGPEFGLQGQLWVSGAAFIGALLTTFVVYHLAGGRSGIHVATLLLAGVAINALAGSILGLLSYYANDDALRLMSFWQMGSLAGADWQQLPLGFLFMGVSCVALFIQRRAINTLLLGERQAHYLGVNVGTLKRRIIFFVALGVGGAVALTGMIGFIGLIIPHIARMLVGANVRWLMPVSMLFGAAILVLTDWLAKTLVAPAELPIGIITAAIGAPFFIYLLMKQRRRFYA